MPRIKASVAAALKSEETVRACAVRQHVHEAMMLLAMLPPSALEALREEFEVMARERTGPRRALKRAWVASYSACNRRCPAARAARHVCDVQRRAVGASTPSLGGAEASVVARDAALLEDPARLAASERWEYASKCRRGGRPKWKPRSHVVRQRMGPGLDARRKGRCRA
jgi:hypothetical protein